MSKLKQNKKKKVKVVNKSLDFIKIDAKKVKRLIIRAYTE